MSGCSAPPAMRPGDNRRANQRRRLRPMNIFKTRAVHRLAFRFDVGHLPADHSPVGSGGMRDLRREFSAGAAASMDAGASV